MRFAIHVAGAELFAISFGRETTTDEVDDYLDCTATEEGGCGCEGQGHLNLPMRGGNFERDTYPYDVDPSEEEDDDQTFRFGFGPNNG